jgi:hypothetical protein
MSTETFRHLRQTDKHQTALQTVSLGLSDYIS